MVCSPWSITVVSSMSILIREFEKANLWRESILADLSALWILTFLRVDWYKSFLRFAESSYRSNTFMLFGIFDIFHAEQLSQTDFYYILYQQIYKRYGLCMQGFLFSFTKVSQNELRVGWKNLIAALHSKGALSILLIFKWELATWHAGLEKHDAVVTVSSDLNQI